MAKLVANAEPQKRLFISLLTRDISLVEAVMDLIDNSINSAIKTSGLELRTPEDYARMLTIKDKLELPSIMITLSPEEFVISDTCGGIPLHDARDHVFTFGREIGQTEGSGELAEGDSRDTLSVYGIGLKRAIFKIGDHVTIRSAHPDKGFEMDLRVTRWESVPQAKWTIPITEYDQPLRNATYGTEIRISDFFPDISRRLGDGAFGQDLVRRIGRAYCYFLNRVVTIAVNGVVIAPIDIEFRENRAVESFKLGDVACAVIAGIAAPQGKFYTSETSGWFVFCNGRAVAYADKTELTGWGLFLPIYQPKHRPFAGLVFFTSSNAELLPWTTTKASINQESLVWQHALRIMGTVGKQVTSYLDSRYSADGTEISVDDLQQAGGAVSSVLTAVSTADRKVFSAPPAKSDTTTIKFDVKPKERDEVRKYLGRKATNGEIGREAFDYFLKNVVRE